MKKLILLLVLPLTTLVAIDFTMTTEGLFTEQTETTQPPTSGTGSEVSNPYLEPVNLPKCTEDNPEVQFIRSKADWSTINGSKRIFCVSPGDYRSLGNIKLTASGTADERRYIILNNGNDIHPGKLNKTQLANFALDLKAASYWVIDRAASLDTISIHSFILNKNSSHNIFNKLFTKNVYHAIWIKNYASNNTIQNSRFDGVNKKGAYADLAAINLFHGSEKSVEIKNTKSINNEFVNVKPFRIAKHQLSGDGMDSTSPRQHVNAEGTIFNGNTVEYTDSIRTDCNGELDPNGLCSQVETGLGIKAGSDNPENPVIYSDNHIWGYRTVDPTIPNLSGTGVVAVAYMGANHIKIRNNVLFDGENGLRLADKYDARYGTEYAEVTGNLFYNIGSRGKAKNATAILVSQSLNNVVRDNIIINPTGKWAHIWSNKNLYFGNNTVINPDETDVLMGGYTPKGMETNNIIFKTAIQAGYTKDYKFTTDKFTNTPRIITLKNVLK